MALLCASLAPFAQAQGFGNSKKKVTLHRKLPAAVHMTGTSFDVHVVARDTANADLAESLNDQLTAELLKDDKRLRAEHQSPDTLITCTISQFETPPPQNFTRNEVVLQKGHNLEEPKKFYKVTGSLAVAYQAKEPRNGHVLDSDNVKAKYEQEFEADTNQASGQNVATKIANPFKRLAGKKTEETNGPPTPIELRQKLLTQVVQQVASRVVNTDEVLEVPLARGKLDSANKLAESGLWTRNLETLETMTPFPTPADDAYRIYNIGVAYEALAYQTEDRAAAKKFLEQAAINYGKAIDAKPDEKYFLEPQNRIETAITHYKKLQGGATATSAQNTRAVNSELAASSTSPSAAPPPEAPAKSGTGRGSPGSKGPALTNDEVVKMVKAGVDEDSIVAAIHDAASVQFDLSPEGLIQLANDGVKGKVVAAMRQRARPATHRKPASNPQ